MRNRLSPSGLMASLLSAGVLLGSAAFAINAAAVPFDVQIYDRTENRYLPTYEFQGRTYVVGKPGNEYALTLRNQSGERVLAVSSVDGINIVSGETASPMQTGYVLSPGQSAEIKGWRKSLAQTAAFYFTEHDNSYAARTGRPNDVGVIGVALFRERRALPPPIPYPQSPRWDGRSDDARPSTSNTPYGAAVPYKDSAGAPGQSGDAAPSAAPYAQQSEPYRRQEKSLGTGHGRQEQSQTRYTDFQRASSSPEQVVTIYYDTYSNLLAVGVPVADEGRYAWRKPQPRPFPRDPTYGFVPDPR